MKYSIIKNNFAKASSSYISNAIVQKNIQNTLLKSSTFLTNVNTILNIGIRDISEPNKLSSIFDNAKIDAIDITLDGISTDNDNISLHQLNYDTELDSLPSEYDLVFSNMSLQWTKDFPSLIKKLRYKIKPNGYLIFSVPIAGNFAELENILRTNSMPKFESIIDILIKNDFYPISQKINQEIRFGDFRSMLRHIKKTGINSYTGSQAPNTAKLRTFIRQNNPTNLTYKAGIFICKKGVINAETIYNSDRY